MDFFARKPIAEPTFTGRRLVLLRASRIARVLFYTVTVGAALAAVVATNASDGTGPWLSEWSWYLLMGGLLMFAVMVLLQAWLVVGARATGDTAEISAEPARTRRGG